MDTQTEREMQLARDEMRRRLQWAAEERLARQARQVATQPDEAEDAERQRAGPFAWLRRLAP
jgi:hypothetical protein